MVCTSCMCATSAVTFREKASFLFCFRKRERAVPNCYAMQFKCTAVFVSVAIFCVSARPRVRVPGIFHDCGSTGLTISDVNVTPTCTATPCVVPKGTNASIAIEMKANADFDSLTNKVYGKVSGLEVPFPIPQPDACKDGIACPLKNGQTYTEKVIVPVKNEYPAIEVDVKWEISDEKGNQQGCIEIVIQIKS